MTNFLSNVQLSVSLIVIILCGAGYIYQLHKKYKQQGKDAAKDMAIGDLRETAYELFLKAEKKYGPGAGAQKMAAVVTAFYKYITKDEFAALLPDTKVETFLQDAFDKGIAELKDYLDDGQLNNSVKTETEQKQEAQVPQQPTQEYKQPQETKPVEAVQTSDQQKQIEQK